jgi:hypothetical protein
MEALRAFAESVGYKGDIMDGVVTECAGGAIEEIHWRRSKDLDGTLLVGDLNMPKLRVLDLFNNYRLKGERESERVGCVSQRMSEGYLLNRFFAVLREPTPNNMSKPLD